MCRKVVLPKCLLNRAKKPVLVTKAETRKKPVLDCKMGFVISEFCMGTQIVAQYVNDVDPEKHL